MKHRWLYPANWEQMAVACKARAGGRCEACGIAHGSQVVNEDTGVVRVVYLAATHPDHDPWNEQARLRCLCPSCHMRYDWSWQQRERRVALEKMRHRILLRYRFGLSVPVLF